MGLELRRDEKSVTMATLRRLFNCFSQLRTKRCTSRTCSHL